MGDKVLLKLTSSEPNTCRRWRPWWAGLCFVLVLIMLLDSDKKGSLAAFSIY